VCHSPTYLHLPHAPRPLCMCVCVSVCVRFLNPLPLPFLDTFYSPSHAIHKLLVIGAITPLTFIHASVHRSALTRTHTHIHTHTHTHTYALTHAYTHARMHTHTHTHTRTHACFSQEGPDARAVPLSCAVPGEGRCFCSGCCVIMCVRVKVLCLHVREG
jgi:hypothetical protein